MDEKNVPPDKLPVASKVQASGQNKWAANLDYRALFEQTRECVFIIGLDFRFITANQQALQLLGYEEYQLVGLPVEEITSFEDGQKRAMILEKHLNVSEHTLKKKNGAMLPVELGISVVHNDFGVPTYLQMLAICRSANKPSGV
jgi:PAS domain S-box-containing protein